MEFVFGLEDIRVLARQHAAGLPDGAGIDRGESLFKVLGELTGCRKEVEVSFRGRGRGKAPGLAGRKSRAPRGGEKALISA